MEKKQNAQKRKQVVDTTSIVNIDLDTYTIDDVIKRLNELKNRFGGEAQFDIYTYDCNGYYDQDTRIKTLRLETDDEYNARLEKNAKALKTKRNNLAKKKREKEEKDRELYAKLKKKFDNNC